jgi:hypothetical protein
MLTYSMAYDILHVFVQFIIHDALSIHRNINGVLHSKAFIIIIPSQQIFLPALTLSCPRLVSQVHYLLTLWP